LLFAGTFLLNGQPWPMPLLRLAPRPPGKADVQLHTNMG
jgi:hypothetical protein